MQTMLTIAELHARAERQVDPHQRRAESVTAFLGRPYTLYAVLALVGAWIALNMVAPASSEFRFDPPPFQYLQVVMSFGAILTALLVLITQNRLDKLGERRAQLDLQISLMAEQKTTKLIALLEEMRRDSPHLRDRHDPEAEAMAEPADPAAILVALETRIGEAMEDIEDLEAGVAETGAELRRIEDKADTSDPESEKRIRAGE